METLWYDLRFGFRTLLKSPGFTAVAVLALALGIGANSAIFSVINAVLLRPLPFKDPDRLLWIWETKPHLDKSPHTMADFVDYKHQNQVFEQIAAHYNLYFNLTGVEEPERILGARVTASLFPLLGATAALGRTLMPEEDRPGGHSVVVVSHGLWERRFGSDPGLIGKALTLNGTNYTVVGIMPPGFQYPLQAERIELWVPLPMSDKGMKNRVVHFLSVIARLKPGVPLRQAQAQMDTIARHLQQEYPNTNANHNVKLVPLHEQVVGDARPALSVLLGAVGFVLLIACANVANLLLARSGKRQKEMAIRLALGASRGRLIRQLLTESVLLAILSGALGLGLAYWGTNLLTDLNLGNISRVKESGIDNRVLGFTLLASLATGIIFGLVPALQASKPNLNESLKEGGRSSTSGLGRNRAHHLLVVSEVALASVLLLSAGLMIKSFAQLQRVNPGFDPENVLTLQIALPPSTYREGHQVTAFFQQALQQAQMLPGVQSVAAIDSAPLAGEGVSTTFTIEGRPKPESGQEPSASYRVISLNYFRTMGIPLLKGRDFIERDTKGAPRVSIINQTMARRFWPGEDPIGKHLSIDIFGEHISPEIVGVVGDVKHSGLDSETKPEMYMPHLQNPWTIMTLIVRCTSNPLGMNAAVRRQILVVDKNQPVSKIRTMTQLLSDSIAPRRLNMLLLSIFATVALGLAIMGIYSVVSYSVTQRTHEIGIRMALGALPGSVFKLVVGQAMILVLAGVILGLVAAFGLTRLMSSLLVGVSTTDAATFVSISLLLTAVALVASFIPARRAAKVDPMVALRYE